MLNTTIKVVELYIYTILKNDINYWPFRDKMTNENYITSEPKH